MSDPNRPSNRNKTTEGNPLGEWEGLMEKQADRPGQDDHPERYDQSNQPDRPGQEAYDQRAYLERQIERAPGEARHYVNEIVSLEGDFAKRYQALQGAGQEMSQKEFEKWEDELGTYWGMHEQALKVLPSGRREAAALAEAPMMREHEEVDDTIETQAGRFFEARATDLRNAIHAADLQDEEKRKDLSALNGFYKKAAEHVAIRYLTPAEVRENYGDSYEGLRTLLHNEVVKGFNEINALTEKYQTRAFIPRDFWSSDKSQPTLEVKSRMKHDRHQIERYCVYAFPDEETAGKRRLGRAMRGEFY